MAKGSKDFFNSEEKHGWWISAASITMLSTTAQIPLVQSRILAEQGISGIWLLASVFLGSGLAIYFFSRYWQSSGLKNDNDFVLLRFDAPGAGILHKFRAIYVGLIVFPIICAMMLVSFLKVLQVYSGFQVELVVWIIVVMCVLSVLFTNFTQKVIRDGILIWLFLPSLILVSGYSLFMIMSESLPVLPADLALWNRQPWSELIGTSVMERFSDVLIFVGILWWSNGVLDGSGGDAQRFLNTKSPEQAGKAALISTILFSFSAGAFLLINIAAMGLKNADSELNVLHFLFEILPSPLSFLMVIVLLMAFLTTVDGFLNVAASYLYSIRKESTSEHINTRQAQSISLGLLLVSGIFVYVYQSVTDLLYLMLAMGAGVGPVFALRWFWMRLNAWSQLSAMLSSLILAVTYDILTETSSTFSNLTADWSESLRMSPYGFKIVVLTLVVSCIWLVVTFLTTATSAEKVREFKGTLFGESSSLHKMEKTTLWLWVKVGLVGIGLALLYFWGYGLVVLVG